MRGARVLVTHLRAKVEISRQPHLKATPVLIFDRFSGASEVVAGMTLGKADSLDFSLAVKIEGIHPWQASFVSSIGL